MQTAPAGTLELEPFILIEWRGKPQKGKRRAGKKATPTATDVLNRLISGELELQGATRIEATDKAAEWGARSLEGDTPAGVIAIKESEIIERFSRKCNAFERGFINSLASDIEAHHKRKDNPLIEKDIQLLIEAERSIESFIDWYYAPKRVFNILGPGELPEISDSNTPDTAATAPAAPANYPFKVIGETLKHPDGKPPRPMEPDTLDSFNSEVFPYISEIGPRKAPPERWEPAADSGKPHPGRYENTLIEYEGKRYRIFYNTAKKKIGIRLETAPDGANGKPRFFYFDG